MGARAPARWPLRAHRRRPRARWSRIALVALGTLVPLVHGCSEARVDPEGAREARAAMVATVAAQFREPPASLGVLEFEPVTWKNACLEIGRRGPCPAGSIRGYRLRLSRRGEPYEFRATAADPADVALASAPNPHVGTPALTWTWPSAPDGCQQLVVTADARPVLGWCDGPMAELQWLDGTFAAAEWAYLSERFQPFTLDGDPSTVFAGRGGESPGTPWRDAIATWASLRWSELRAGRSGAAHGRVFAYHRTVRDHPELCDVLEVTEYGVAHLGRSQCEGGGGEPGRAAWLSDELWARLHGWLGSWSAYRDPGSGLELFGTGSHRPTAAEVRELTRWADRAMAHVAYSDREAWPVSR